MPEHDERHLLVSNFGTDRLERMTRGGRSRVLADSIDGQPIGKVSFVLRGSLQGTRIPYFHAPVAGLPMAHWTG